MEIKIVIKLDEPSQKDVVIETQLIAGNVLIEESDRADGKYLIFTAFDREKWLNDNVRPQRNNLLAESDKMMLADKVRNMSPEEFDAWCVYRQALLDLPGTFEGITQPIKIVWPVKPE